ncbi:sensor histidine kinase [Paenibacillus faecalis]|uniref:sensor histidine kinase n=1 Tax=Paenibacillus faecalis TaxID=2079532 RepID=UPI001F1C39D7|nr:sensor histidine kinase [Paenibacillus faecalis]
MKVPLILRVFVFFMFAEALLYGNPGAAYGKSPEVLSISEWSILWSSSAKNSSKSVPLNVPVDAWQPAASKMKKPPDAEVVWIKMKLPVIDSHAPGILIEKIYGKEISVFADQIKLYESSRTYNYKRSQVLLPLHADLSADHLYIRAEVVSNYVNMENEIYIGDFQTLFIRFIKNNLADIVLGCTFIFIAGVMLIWSIFLNKRYRASVLSLSLIILSVGILVFTYSPFIHTLLEEYGHLFTELYDIALLVLLPSFSLFFEKIFGPGRKNILRKVRKFQIGYSAFCFMFWLLNDLNSDHFYDIYYFFSVKVLGLMMILQFMLLLGSSMVYAVKGNKNAVIFNIGFAVFAVISLGELIRFFVSGGDYQLDLWKWGVVGFIAALLIILGRAFAQNHEQIIKYSQELKMFNNELQRAEKMDIISELAASVAHEVRNPLQVTRGFLQLLIGKSSAAEREYLSMAMVELDRASGIITDFLTFAKPEYGKIAVLKVSDEFKHIEGILAPLAHLQGGTITVDIPDNICIQGNSSKFKQALINIIKNSVEALDGEGRIHIRAYILNGTVRIHIEDNGEGMDIDVLSRLGEPYFSNKTKGTGLGLMVTFRIIEAMEGSIHYSSKKGVGTEAVITLPAADS